MKNEDGYVAILAIIGFAILIPVTLMFSDVIYVNKSKNLHYNEIHSEVTRTLYENVDELALVKGQLLFMDELMDETSEFEGLYGESSMTFLEKNEANEIEVVVNSEYKKIFNMLAKPDEYQNKYFLIWKDKEFQKFDYTTTNEDKEFIFGSNEHFFPGLYNHQVVLNQSNLLALNGLDYSIFVELPTTLKNATVDNIQLVDNDSIFHIENGEPFNLDVEEGKKDLIIHYSYDFTTFETLPKENEEDEDVIVEKTERVRVEEKIDSYFQVVGHAKSFILIQRESKVGDERWEKEKKVMWL